MGLCNVRDFLGSVDIFGTNRDMISVGCCEGYLVLMMVLNVRNATVIVVIVDCEISPILVIPVGPQKPAAGHFKAVHHVAFVPAYQ